MLTTVNVDNALISRILRSTGFTNFLKEYNVLITAVLSIVTISIIVLFFVNVVKFSSSADNDNRRRTAMSGILVCLVCFGCIGGIDILYSILLGFIFGM